MTKSGYTYEVEVKISRSDFFADFKKEKHRLFESAAAKKKFHVSNCGEAREDLICEFEHKVLEPRYRNHYSDIGAVRDYHKSKMYFNDWSEHRLRQKWERIYAPATSICIEEIEKKRIPHRFYFATPQGLIKEKELPPYAGLIEMVDDYRCQIVIEATFLHKRPAMDKIRQILLDKFWYLSEKHRTNKEYDKYQVQRLTLMVENLQKQIEERA